MTASLAHLEFPGTSGESPLEGWAQHELEQMGDFALVFLAVQAPVVPLDRFLELARADEDALIWDPPAEAGFAGIGCVREVRAVGGSRFVDVRRAAAELFASVATVHRERPGERLELLFGGFSCFSTPHPDPLWEQWGEARFVLPRLLYKLHSDGTATLGIACDFQKLTHRRDTVQAAARQLGTCLQQLAQTGTQRSVPEVVSTVAERTELGEAEWQALVSQIQHSIAAEDLEKVVAARRSSLSLVPSPEWREVLLRLGADNSSCTRFALHHAASTFLGATPERLVRKSGKHFDTEALAGSARSGAESAQLLLASRKDLDEHAIVVREILRALEPYAHELSVPKAPHVHALHYVSHLRTPIEGSLAAPTHILDLVAALHPTPAVGGVPKEQAQRFIQSHERDDRGWYAGPIGWFDREGDGSFAVALRSALMLAGQAHLYAGAGIVRASDPHSEYQETELKLQGLLRALGVAE